MASVKKTKPATTSASTKKASVAKKVMPPKKATPAKTPASAKAAKVVKALKAAKPGKPPVIKWGPQNFVVNHLKPSDFKTGLRSYAKYRDLGIAEATGGAVQAHVIRLLGPCDPKVVAIPHYHGVQFQMIYLLKGWMLGEYEGQGKIKMKAGSCWLQPNGIRHTVLDYSDDCEMVEIILPGNFDTVTFE